MNFRRRTLSKSSLLLLAFALANPLPLFAQETRARILVPEENKKTTSTPNKDNGQRGPRPELILQTGVTIPATVISFSPDGKLLASMGLQAGAIKLWEIATGRELYNLNLGARGATTTSINSAFIFSPDGTKIFSSSAGVIREWDARTGKQMRATAILSEGQDFGAAVFSPDGRWLATSTQARTSLTVWDVANGRPAQKIENALDSGVYIHAIAFSPDGRLIATGEESNSGATDQRTLVLREVGGGRVARTIKVDEVKPQRPTPGSGYKSSTPVREIHFSPDGRIVGMAIRDPLYEQTIGSVAEARPVGQENTVRLWDVGSGRELRTIAVAETSGSRPGAGLADYSTGHSLTFSADNRLVASIGNDKMVKIYEAASGRQTASITGHEGDIVALAISNDGKQIATSGSDSSIRIWDLASATTGGQATLVRAFSGAALPVFGIAYGDDGRTLVVGAPQAVNLWEFSTGSSIRTLEFTRNAPRRLTEIMDERPQVFFSAGGQFIAASQNAKEMKVWETRTGREVRTITRQSDKPMTGGDLSSDGKLIAIADRVNAAPRSTAPGSSPSTPSANPSANPSTNPSANPSPGQMTIPFPMPPDQSGSKKDDKKKKDDKDDKKRARMGQLPPEMQGIMNGIDMSQIQKMAEAAQRGEFGKIQEIMGQVYGGAIPAMAGAAPTGVRVLDLNAGNEVQTIPGAQALGIQNRAMVAFSPDGKRLATASAGHRIGVNDLATGREIFALKADRGFLIDRLAFSPDGRFLAAAMMETRAGINLTSLPTDMSMSSIYSFTVRLWDISDPNAGGRELTALNGHTSSVTALAFSPDGKQVATGGYDAQVKLWDMGSGREIKSFAGHTLGVTAIAFSPDGRTIVSGSEDGGARLWDVASGELEATMVTLNRGADWLVVTPDGLFDGTPAAWSQILWRFSENLYDVTPVEVFFNEFYSPGLLASIYSGQRPRAAQEISAKDRRQPLVAIETENAAPSSRTIKVRIEVSEPPASGSNATPTGARDVRLFRNGTLVKVWRGDVLKDQKQIVLEAEIPIVAGDNRLTAYAFNRDNIKSADAALTVKGATSLARRGTAWVLAVGINRYANEGYNLKYAVADATTFAEEFRAQQAKLNQYERTELVTLTDAEATKENLLAALRTLAGAATGTLPAALQKLKRAEPEDAVLIYFAGHGTARGSRFYLVPHDLGYTGSRTEINAAAIETILSRSISDLELEAAVEGLDSERLIMVIDACNSGQALEAEEKRRGPMNSKGLAQLAYEKGMYILTAAQSYQAALEASQLGHGYLTYALVEEGLKQGKADRDLKDGQVMVREWFNYATDRVPQMQEKEIRGRLLLFVEGEENIKDPARRSVQRPRVFYRRELEAHPFVVAKP